MNDKNSKNNNPDLNNETDNSIPIERADNKTAEPIEIQDKEIGGVVENNNEELKAALDKILELEKQNTDLKDTLLRKVADFENFKRRNENDQLNLLKYAAEPFIKSILAVYDDLERSIIHIDDENNFESMKKGLQLVYEKFNKILDAQGVKKIDAKGQPFDVNLHEALMQQPAVGVEPHTVLNIIEPGYIYKDKVIRHAKVIVSAELASQDEQDQNFNGEGK